MRVGSMFAGIGGICLGFMQAGAQVVWANEKDRFACATYRYNFGSDYLIEDDIQNVIPDQIPDIDILTAGFPCQPFSKMGRQQGFRDNRGSLYYEILRVIDAKHPRILLLENVKNLLNHDNGQTFLTIYNSLAERGYAIKYSVLSPYTHADIPQLRDRIFIAAFLDYVELSRFSFPSEVQLTKSINDIIDRSATVSKEYYYDQTSCYYSSLNDRMTNDNSIYRIDDSGIATKAWTLCPTLKANMGTYKDRVPVVRDNFGIRKLTPADCLAFQGFPRSYSFPLINKNEIYKQLGNTVCVPVVKRIADAILKAERIEFT